MMYDEEFLSKCTRVVIPSDCLGDDMWRLAYHTEGEILYLVDHDYVYSRSKDSAQCCSTDFYKVVVIPRTTKVGGQLIG